MVTLTFNEETGVIFVSGDSAEITMQQLLNGVRDWEDELEDQEESHQSEYKEQFDEKEYSEDVNQQE